MFRLYTFMMCAIPRRIMNFRSFMITNFYMRILKLRHVTPTGLKGIFFILDRARHRPHRLRFDEKLQNKTAGLTDGYELHLRVYQASTLKNHLCVDLGAISMSHLIALEALEGVL